jgi:hypothetical protein
MNDITNKYFEWLYDLMCHDRFAKDISYRKLLMHLHNTEFIYSVRKDRNRAEDGMDLRYRFAHEYSTSPRYLDGPCSVLEMMVGLAIRCEETIMDDPRLGDRTGQWFWGMITNLGLGSMYDSNFDRKYVDEAIHRFLKREYSPNGRGGLFTVRNCDEDLRKLEIWHQLCLYLDTIG